MKENVLLRVALTLVLAMLLPALTLAKSEADKLTVEGPGLNTPVEITDPAELSGTSPWGRKFIAWDRGLVLAPPPAERTYTVSFYVKDRKIYVLEYAPDPSGGPGSIYIPGPDHPAYRLNIGTIVGASTTDRWAPEGKWQYATAEWYARIQRALQARSATPPASASAYRQASATSGLGGEDAASTPGRPPLPTVPVPNLWASAVMAVGLLGSLAWLIWRRHQHTTG